MVLFIICYVKFAPVYPEYNRDRMLVISHSAIAQEGAKEWNNCSSGASPKIAELVKELPHLDQIGIGTMVPPLLESAVLLPQSNEQLEVTQGMVDAGFWKVFTFRFLNGKPFDEEAVEASLPVAVLSENLAKRIFASTDVTGQHFKLDGKEVKVIGVVADATGATPATAADLYLPLYYGDLGNLIRPNKNPKGLLGSNSNIYLTATSEEDVETLRTEVIDVLNRYDQENKEWAHFWMDQPDVWWKSTFRDACSSAPDIPGIVRGILYMLLALLFIPAMNLCGMISSRMDERMSELGVRKAYGATNASLISQVLTENLLLTLIGGLVGMVLAYLVALTGGNWVFNLFDTFVIPGGINPSFTVEMLFNPTLFLTVFGLCILLNLISALVPTILALRHTIIYSIQSKR
jgi:ABC-type antimicrobial peptide transport system permease subunit